MCGRPVRSRCRKLYNAHRVVRMHVGFHCIPNLSRGSVQIRKPHGNSADARRLDKGEEYTLGFAARFLDGLRCLKPGESKLRVRPTPLRAARNQKQWRSMTVRDLRGSKCILSRPTWLRVIRSYSNSSRLHRRTAREVLFKLRHPAGRIGTAGHEREADIADRGLRPSFGRIARLQRSPRKGHRFFDGITRQISRCKREPFPSRKV